VAAGVLLPEELDELDESEVLDELEESDEVLAAAGLLSEVSPAVALPRLSVR
jgi:hypothetical protein